MRHATIPIYVLECGVDLGDLGCDFQDRIQMSTTIHVESGFRNLHFLIAMCNIARNVLHLGDRMGYALEISVHPSSLLP